MTAGKSIKWATGIFAALIIAGMFAYPKVVAQAPQDDAQITEIKFANLMGTRYTEILVVWGNALTKNFVAGVYNSVGLNGANPAGGGDSTPAILVDKIDMKKVQEDNHGLSTVKNGPRLWTVDHIGVKAGKERDFQGLKARWVAWFFIPAAILEQDLEFMTDSGKTMITQDELGNTYDRVGGPYSNFKP